MQNIAANSADVLATIEKRDFFVEPPKDGFTACRQSISAVALSFTHGLNTVTKSPELYSGLLSHQTLATVSNNL